MGTVTNLNRFRKQKTRAEKRAKGNANAALHGRSKAEKQAQDKAAQKAKTQLDGHKISPHGDD